MALVTVHCVTINALDPSALAGFWAALSGGTARDSGNGFVLVEPAEGGTRLHFQKADAPAEICRLGGSLVERRSDSHAEWVVMADPEGNPFCI